MFKCNMVESCDLNFVACKARKDITLSYPNEKDILIAQGCQILVDPEEGIGLVADNYFEIFPEEYSLLSA